MASRAWGVRHAPLVLTPPPEPPFAPLITAPVTSTRDLLCLALDCEEDAPPQSVRRVADSLMRQGIDLADGAAYLYR